MVDGQGELGFLGALGLPLYRTYAGPSGRSLHPTHPPTFVVESYVVGTPRGGYANVDDTSDLLRVELSGAGVGIEYAEGDHGASMDAVVPMTREQWRAMAAWCERMAVEAGDAGQ